MHNYFKDTELGPLPEEWRVVILGDFFEFSKKLRGLIINNEQKIPFIPMEFIPEDNKMVNSWQIKKYSEISNGTFVFKNDLIVAKITPSFENGKQAILDNLPMDYGYATTEVWALHPKNEEVIVEYLYYYLKISHIRANMASKMEGTTGRQRLPRHVLKKFKIPLPPLSEQKKIAAVLSAVQEAKEKTEEVIKATKELKKSLMKHLFTYGPVPVEEAENVSMKETEIGPMPEEWEVVRLGEVANVKYGKAKPKDTGNIPVVGSGGVYSNTKNPLVDYATIVIGRKGTAGKVWLFLKPCYPSDTTFYLEWKRDIEVSFLFNYMILNPLSGEHAKTTLPSIQKPDLENFLIPYPPLSEQQRIADIIFAMNRKIEVEQNKMKALEELFKTLLNNLMAAKIRVSHLEIGI